MTPMPNDYCRCMGSDTAGIGHRGICPMREKCQRYTDKGTGPRVPFAMWLCQSPEFEMRIRPEVG